MDNIESDSKNSQTSSSSSYDSSTFSRNRRVWRELERNTDHLMYYCNAYDASTKYLEKYRKWLVDIRNDDVEVLEKLVSQSAILGNKFGDVGIQMEEKINNTLSWLFRKIGWKPNKQQKNVGYAGYEDMLLRYRDLRKELDRMRIINKQVAITYVRIVQEYQMMCQMNEKLEELRYRTNLLNVAKKVAERTQKPQDPLSALFFLPVILIGIIFHPSTSQKYAAKLLRLCKRVLVVSEAVQYEHNPEKNAPIATMSVILAHPPHSNVPSLFVPIKHAQDKEEVKGPEKKIHPVVKNSYHFLTAVEPRRSIEMIALKKKINSTGKDSAHCPLSPKNGEVLAPKEEIVPVARDSVLMVIPQNGEVIAAPEFNEPIAKDSFAVIVSKEPQKPLTTPQNGEVTAASDISTPIAKDSVAIILSKEPPKQLTTPQNGEVIATSDVILPIAKDSVAVIVSKEPPRPLTPKGDTGVKKPTKNNTSQRSK